MRRLLGPITGPVTFILVAALVFAGLAWVTVASLRVEAAQREAAAQTELGNNLRVAVRQLDTRFLSTLTVEDNRPFHHYISADPLFSSNAGPTPLLAAPLPEWMKLHVQLDPATGWESPQVLTPEAAKRVAAAWPELPLRNNVAIRADALEQLRRNYPSYATWELLAARDLAAPDDARPFATPLVDPVAIVPPSDTGPKPPPPPDLGPITASPLEPFFIFGWDLVRLGTSAVRHYVDTNMPKAVRTTTKPPAFPPLAPPQGGAVGRESYPITEKELQQWREYRNRAATIQKATEEARNAGQEFPSSKGQLPNKPDALDQPGNTKKPSPGGLSPAVNQAKPANDDQSKTVVEDDTASDGRAARKPGTGIVPPAEERPLPTTAPPRGMRPVNVHLGSMRPQWLTAEDGTELLVFFRAARIDDRTVFQGIILDWEKLEQILKAEVKEVFPNARLEPVKDATVVSPDRAMTALPIQLEPGVSASAPPTGWSPLRIGLVLAWGAALVAFAAIGFSGRSLIDLAERRIRFVSAVTHELRTPLTSLRLYLDLLMSGMIRDEEKRQEYLNTLAMESDRLHRLVNNVLDYAKLEKRAKNGHMRRVKVSELTEQLRDIWADRITADGRELVVIASLAETELVTDPELVYQIVGNLIDNARKYTRDAEDKRIWLWVKPDQNGRVVFEVEDRGSGVPAGELHTIFKPFRRGDQADTKAGGAGLGLALAKQWAEVLGGTVAYRPSEGAPGSCFRLELPKA